jgi:hypothetical protein
MVAVRWQFLCGGLWRGLGIYVDDLLDFVLHLLRPFRYFTSPQSSSHLVQPPVTSYKVFGRCLN